MVKLKNYEQSSIHDTFMESFLKNKETDCIFYSQEGLKFNIHKEVLYQTKFMRNILLSVHNECCGNIEILCPSSEDELESIVNFLYSGKASSLKVNGIAVILENLTKIFGFPEKLFPVEDCSTLNTMTNLKINEEFEILDKLDEISDEEKTIAETNTKLIPFNPFIGIHSTLKSTL